MPLELIVPSVGESITEVAIGAWLKREGDLVSRDEPLVEIESDKATVQLPAPAAGRLTQLLKKQGEAAQVGDCIGYLEPENVAAAPATAPMAPVVAPATVAAPTARTAASAPAASAPAVQPAREVSIARTPARSATVVAAGDGRQEELVPLSPLRKKIAERLVQAQQTAALLTTFNEVDMSPVMTLRKDNQPLFQERYGVKLGIMSFFVKATIDALKQIPQLNAEVRGDAIAFRNYFDIAVAVGTDKGVVAPVIRDADRLSFAEIEQRIADFGRRGRENKIKLEELKGGTFTISNGGIYGSLLSTPIVNPPQSGILGMHSIQDRPVAVAGQVVIRPMMYLALTYDHRIVDGREAVTFLKRIKEVLETPTRLLLEV